MLNVRRWICRAAVVVIGMASMAASLARAGDGTAFPPLVYAAEGAQKIIKYAPGGAVAWEYPAQMSRDVWQLPNGNVLFCYNDRYDSKKNDNPSGVIEVTPEKKVVFHFATTGQVWSCQRLADGNTLVGAASQGKLLIVNPAGQIVKQIVVLSKGGHSCLRNARQIGKDHFLVTEESAHALREYDADGKLLHETKVSFAPYSAVRLPDGSTVVCGQQWIVKIDSADKVVWSLQGKELPDAGIRWFAGIQVLPNGNLFVCNAGGKVTFLEISLEKRIVWQSNTSAGAFPMGHGIQRLDVTGEISK